MILGTMYILGPDGKISEGTISEIGEGTIIDKVLLDGKILHGVKLPDGKIIYGEIIEGRVINVNSLSDEKDDFRRIKGYVEKIADTRAEKRIDEKDDDRGIKGYVEKRADKRAEKRIDEKDDDRGIKGYVEKRADKRAEKRIDEKDDDRGIKGYIERVKRNFQESPKMSMNFEKFPTKDNEVLNSMEVFLNSMKVVLDQLKNPRRKIILNLLSPGISMTFKQLKVETGVSTGSLHHHLNELCKADLIRKDTRSRPHKYSLSPYFIQLITTIKEIEEKEKVEFD